MHTIHFEKQIYPSDGRSSVAVPFNVPEGTEYIKILFEVSPPHTEGQPLPQQLSLALYEPAGTIRGYLARPREDGLELSSVYATHGTQAGNIAGGEWTLLISIHRVMPTADVFYHGEIILSEQIPRHHEAVEVQPRAIPHDRGAGWYRGDLHAHTHHSDGWWSVAELVDFARAQQLDFLSLTDHDTITGLAELHSLAGDDLVTIGGMELSTFDGHSNALGLTQKMQAPTYFDWRKADGTEIPMPELVARVKASGALTVINHPRAEGYPVCCGCRWEHEDMMPGNAHAVEIWNGLWNARNEEALQLYYHWLNQGHALVATTGTDIHGPPPKGARGALNVVYAEHFSEEGIITALKKGHSYISTGAKLQLEAHAGEQHVMMGDSIVAPENFVCRWQEARANDVVRLIVNGTIAQEKTANNTGDIIYTDVAEVRWLTVELRNAAGGLEAVCHPIRVEGIFNT